MKTLKFSAVIAILAVAVLAFCAATTDAFAGTGLGRTASIFDPTHLVAASAGLVALRSNLADISTRATAKMAEIRDGMPAADQKRIEDEHAELLRQEAKVRKQIEDAEREETEADGRRADQERQLREQAQADERTRVAEITALCDKHGHRDLGQTAINAGQSVAEFRASLLDKLAAGQSGTIQPGIVPAPGTTNAEQRAAAITSSLLHRADPAANTLDQHAREFRGMTLTELARVCLEAHGISTRGLSKSEIAELAVAPGNVRMGGMHTTSDFPILLANVANKTLRQGYEAAPQTFRPLVREVSVPDFKSVNRSQLGEAPAFEKVNEHGEYKYGTVGEASENYAIATYGKIVAITRQVIINDDLGAFTRIPRAFGVSAANLESDLVWAQILMNPNMGDGIALFHASHNNLGTAAGISAASIAAGFEAMRLQKGLDGKTLLNITPKYLITSVAAVMTAAQLYSPIVAAQVANTIPEYLKTLVPISEPRLDGGFTDPASGTAIAGNRFKWYLGADPNQIDTVELAYLEGNRGVYTETRNGFNIDGVEIKVRLDAGAKVIDWRAFFQNPATTL